MYVDVCSEKYRNITWHIMAHPYDYSMINYMESSSVNFISACIYLDWYESFIQKYFNE